MSVWFYRCGCWMLTFFLPFSERRLECVVCQCWSWLALLCPTDTSPTYVPSHVESFECVCVRVAPNRKHIADCRRPCPIASQHSPILFCVFAIECGRVGTGWRVNYLYMRRLWFSHSYHKTGFLRLSNRDEGFVLSLFLFFYWHKTQFPSPKTDSQNKPSVIKIVMAPAATVSISGFDFPPVGNIYILFNSAAFLAAAPPKIQHIF